MYKKLVRDRIPEIMINKGFRPSIHTADNVKFSWLLTDKLQEEIDKYKESGSIEELADILEVVYAIGLNNSIGQEMIRSNKYQERGGFKDKIVLEIYD